MKTFLMTAGTALVLATSAAANTITFSDFDHGDLIPNGAFNFDGITGTITTDNARAGGPDIAAVFDTSVDFATSDPDLQFLTETNTGAAYDGGLALIISENSDPTDPDDEARGGTITFLFDQLVTFTGVSILDAETRHDNQIDVAIDGGVTVLDQIAVGNGQFQDFGGFAYETQSLTFTFGGSGAIDNLQFGAVAPVPIPASAALMLGGLGGLAALRRRKAKA